VDAARVKRRGTGVARVLLAVLSGLGAAASFEPLGWVVLLVPSVAGLSLAVHRLRGRRAFGTGLAFGLSFMGALLPWIQVIGVDAWIGLSFLQALFFGLLGVLLGRVQRLPVWPLWASCCWVLAELLRSTVPWGGFPWGRLAFATVDTPLAAAMPWLGSSGTSALVALLGTTAAWLVMERRWRRPRGLVAAALALLVAATPALAGAGSPDTEQGPTVRVAAVQGNVPGKGMDAFAERRAVLDNHVRATHELAARVDAGATERPDFVVWPENSTDIDPFDDASVHADIQGAVDAIGVPVLVGAMIGGPGPVDVRNQGIVWSPGSGPGESYSKTHPVPFGEYIPHRAQLAQLFERLDQIPRDMVPGTEPGLLDLAGTPVGDVICFEVAYDGVVHDVVDGGAELLVVQTNNATYMDTGQIEQQFATARLRALETGRWVVVVATNGVSGIIAPDGTVVERAPVKETAVLESDVPLRDGLTPALRFSRWWELALLLVAAGAVSASLAQDRRARRAVRPAAAVTTPATAPTSTPTSTRSSSAPEREAAPVDPAGAGGAR
jgi:apolipoprotein N-acyltransferase